MKNKNNLQNKIVEFIKNAAGTIVGEVALHETDIVTENGNITQLVLAQSAVSPEYRMQGIIEGESTLPDFWTKCPEVAGPARK